MNDGRHRDEGHRAWIRQAWFGVKAFVRSTQDEGARWRGRASVMLAWVAFAAATALVAPAVAAPLAMPSMAGGTYYNQVRDKLRKQRWTPDVSQVGEAGCGREARTICQTYLETEVCKLTVATFECVMLWRRGSTILAVSVAGPYATSLAFTGMSCRSGCSQISTRRRKPAPKVEGTDGERIPDGTARDETGKADDAEPARR